MELIVILLCYRYRLSGWCLHCQEEVCVSRGQWTQFGLHHCSRAGTQVGFTVFSFPFHCFLTIHHIIDLSSIVHIFAVISSFSFPTIRILDCFFKNMDNHGNAKVEVFRSNQQQYEKGSVFLGKFYLI